MAVRAIVVISGKRVRSIALHYSPTVRDARIIMQFFHISLPCMETNSCKLAFLMIHASILKNIYVASSAGNDRTDASLRSPAGASTRYTEFVVSRV